MEIDKLQALIMMTRTEEGLVVIHNAPWIAAISAEMALQADPNRIEVYGPFEAPDDPTVEEITRLTIRGDNMDLSYQVVKTGQDVTELVCELTAVHLHERPWINPDGTL